MEIPLHLQKLCRADARKMLVVMGVIAFSVLVIQYYFVPYGSILMSLFPSGLTSFLETNSPPSLDTSNNVVAGSYSSLSNSTSNYLSPSPQPGISTGVATGPEQISPVGLGNAETPYNGSISEAVGKPLEHVGEDAFSTLETDGEEDEASTLDKDGSNDTGALAFPPALLPVVVLADPVSVENIGTGSLAPPSAPPAPPASPPGVALASPVMVVSKGTVSISPPPAVPPVISIANPVRDANLGDSFTVTNSSNISSSVIQNAPGDLHNSGNPDISKNSPITTPLKKGWWQLPPESVTTISEMSNLLLQTHASSLSMKPHWSSERDGEILSAKYQIENAPIITSNTELYSSLFRNVSMFKRSYELMEQILKVYIYKEGDRPIFHQPNLRGIYASEGWFMRHMQTKNRFLTRDPRQAHLFYLPFSTRALEERLYVPNSHSHKNLIEHLKKYLDLISTKYPFWNKTEGADHFLVACHDWAPAETKDYMNNCVRAMCNADVNVGFKIGKDVSLPETNVRNAKDPLRDLGGKPPSNRDTLAFFAGKMHGYLRPILLEYWENKDPDMKIFKRLPRGKSGKMQYINYMQRSKYCICAKGYEVNSPRVVESIFFECVPVIISDNYVPPFFEVLNWESFAVFIPEKDIPNLKSILASIPDRKYLKLQMGVRRAQQHFIWHTTPVKYDIFHMILHSIWYNRVFQVKPN